MLHKLPLSIRGAIYILLSAFMYATMPILAKLAYSVGLTPSSTLLLRYFFALIIIAVYLRWIKKTAVFTFSTLTTIQGVALVTGSLFFFCALKYLSAGLTTVIFFTYPVIVALLAIIVFKEKISAKLLGGLVLAMLGIILVSGIIAGSFAISTRGLILASLASLCYAFYSIISQATVADNSPFSLTATFSLISIIIIAIFFSQELSFIASLNFKQVVAGLCMGLFNTVLSVSLFLKGVKSIGASRASLISTAEPIFTLVLAFALLQETLTPLEMLGSALVFISMFLVVASPKQILDSSHSNGVSS